MNLQINIHHSSISATVNGKYIETNSIDKLMEHITEADIERMEKFNEEHLENNSYDGEEFAEEHFEINE